MEMSIETHFNDLEKQLDVNSTKLEKWSSNYFITHKKRYLEDIKLINKYFNTGQLLELGSAPYHLTFLMKRTNMNVIGVDISPERFQKFITYNDLNIIKCDIEKEKLPFQDNEFDCIIFNEIFEHLRINPIETLLEINRVLKIDGILILTTPNLYSIRNVINFILGKGFDNPYKEFQKINEIGHMGHVREYSSNQVQEFLKNTGFKSIHKKMKSHQPLTGMWRIFNIVREILPQFHSYQIQISKKN